ncbi:hypothetical protein HRbin27_01190 [bacterium HR27]|nr:hypothetical protein HRbin27_01190 [bacterium HR27]
MIRAALVQEDHEVLSVREGNEVLRIEGAHVVAVRGEPQVVHHLRQQQATHIGARREPVAGKVFLGHRGAPDVGPPFEDENSFASTSQVPGSDQTIVPGTDDYGVVVLGVHALIPSYPTATPVS